MTTNPVNNAADLPEEVGLEGFSIVLEDGGGRYGVSAGTASQDVFGNPLGTTYRLDGCRNTEGTMYRTPPTGSLIPIRALPTAAVKLTW